MVSSIVTCAAQQLGGLVAKEAKHLYEVSDKIELVERDLRWMHCFLEDADNRQHSEKIVAMWVAEIRDLAYEAEEIIEKYVHKVSHPRRNGSWNTIRWLLCALCDAQALHEVGSDIDKLRTRIAELLSRLQLYGVKVTKEEAGLSFAIRQTYSHIDEDPVGLEKHTRDVVDQLLRNEQVKVVGICGMGGLGKTTLARQVFQDATTRERFKHRAWVCISKKFEARAVFKDILLELSNANANAKTELCDVTDGQVPLKICEILKQNTCLVVLDDVWSKEDWNALRPAFDSIKTSPSKILITTRNSGLIQCQDSFEYSHNLNLLNNDDSWKLFRRIAFLETEFPEAESLPVEEMESDQTNEESDIKGKQKLGWKMVKHCKGLPLAILTLGGVLRNKKTLSEWESVQKNITSYLMGDVEQGCDNKGLFAIMELSYKDLPFYLKPCFMYLAIFPEDHKIPALKLYHLWEAEGLVTACADEVRLDDIAESYLNELVRRCLVQVDRCWANGRISRIRLHDVMRDMCLKKCNEVNFLSIVKDGGCSSSKAVGKLRRCALYLGETKSDDPPFGFDPTPSLAPCIRSLLVFQDRTDPKKVFSPKVGKFFSLLRVLDHENSCDILLRPKILKHFIHLRYLSFKGAVLDTITGLSSHIWECKFLETLDLRCQFGSYLYVGLSNKMWKLERLRHLYLPIDMEFRGKLERLRDLYLPIDMEFRGNSKRLILTDSQLQQMETLKNFDPRVCEIKDLRKMTSLRVISFDYWKLSMEEVEHVLKSPMVAARRLVKPLHLRVVADVVNQGTALLAQIQSLVCVSGFGVSGRIDAAASLEILDKMYLTKLYLYDSQIEQQGIAVIERLVHLEELVLEGKAIAGNNMSFCDGGFARLNALHFSCLYGLEEWEVGEGALPNLQHLRIHFCEDLKMIPPGLPNSVYVSCLQPCVTGVDKYNICPHAGFAYEDYIPSESSVSNAKRLLSTCFSCLHH